MTIEFHTINGVSEEIIQEMKMEVMKLKHLDPHITRAEIMFRKRGVHSDNKICELRLTVSGHFIFVLRRAGTFEESSRLVMKYLRRTVKEYLRESKSRLAAAG